MLLVSFRVYSDDDKLFPLLNTDGFTGVVVPVWYDSTPWVKGDKNGFWTPQAIQIFKKLKNVLKNI